MKFVNKFHSNSILPFSICRIKSGSVIQTKHFDIKMSLEIRQAKSFFLTLWVMFFASFHFFIFFILRITINCNYLFTKHFKYKTLIYLCQRSPPPEKFVVFYLYKRWVGGMVIRCCRCFFGMRWYLHGWDIRYRRCSPTILTKLCIVKHKTSYFTHLKFRDMVSLHLQGISFL